MCVFLKVNWTTGEPNPRYHVLELLISKLSGKGVTQGVLSTNANGDDSQMYAQGFTLQEKEGTFTRNAILLVNKSPDSVNVKIDAPSGFGAAEACSVDETTSIRYACAVVAVQNGKVEVKMMWSAVFVVTFQ